MKQIRLITTLVAIALFANLGFAENPNKKDYTKNLADNMLKYLCIDIQLTDSQKLAIQTIAKDYEIKLRSKDQQPNSESKKTMNKQIVLEYRSKLNTILTKEQQDTLTVKRIERAKISRNIN